MGKAQKHSGLVIGRFLTFWVQSQELNLGLIRNSTDYRPFRYILQLSVGKRSRQSPFSRMALEQCQIQFLKVNLVLDVYAAILRFGHFH